MKLISTLILFLFFQTLIFAQTTFDWSRVINSADDVEYPYDMATDASGDMYIVGRTFNDKAIVKKLSSDGQTIHWSTIVANDGFGSGIALDASGNVYVSGGTENSTLIGCTGDCTKGGTWDAFVTKLNSSDGTITSATFFGGSGDENNISSQPVAGTATGEYPMKLGMDVDGAGNIFITGYTNSTTGIPGNINSYDSYPAVWMGFLAKIAPDFTTFTSQFIGGDWYTWTSDVEVVGSDVYVCGNHYSDVWHDHTMPATATETVHNGYTNSVYGGFILKFATSDLTYQNIGTFVGGANTGFYSTGEDAFLRGIISDGTDIYVVGDIYGGHAEFTYTTGSVQFGRTTRMNILYAKYNADLDTKIYAGYMGGCGDSEGTSILEMNGSIWVGGSNDEGTSNASCIFSTTADAFQGTHGGAEDFVICQIGDKFSSTEKADSLYFSTFLGGAQDDYVLNLAEGSIKGVGATHSATSSPSPFPTPQIGTETDSDDAWVAFSFSPANPLPVELIDFTAKPVKQTVVLDWSTATEINNLGFDIEQSTDGVNFRKIGYVKGNENSINLNQYTYTDYTPFIGWNYYRLKQIDVDGGYEFSDVVSVQIQKKGVDFTIQPNPVKEVLSIAFPRTLNQDYQIEIMDVTGRQILKMTNTNTINVADLPRGLYIIRLTAGDHSTSKKVILK